MIGQEIVFPDLTVRLNLEALTDKVIIDEFKRRFPAAPCDCPADGASDYRVHADRCVRFACPACGAHTVIDEPHLDDCGERCPHCHSEGPDNDHKPDCPTIGTCAQTYPHIPLGEWHPDPPGPIPFAYWTDHLVTCHPGVST